MINKERFMYAFKINRMVIFEVEYGAIKENKIWHFGTSAEEFIRSKRDWNRCGQCQEDVLPKNSVAYKFYKKWDEHHLKNLTNEEYQELVKDIQILKSEYDFIYKSSEYDRHYIPFYELKEMSMNN